MSNEPPKDAASPTPLSVELRKDLLKALLLGFPMLIIGMSVDWLKDRFITEPGQALLIIIPGVLVCLILLTATVRRELKLGWPFLIFLQVFILVFFIAAQTRLLDWKSSLVGYEQSVPRNFLALNRLGDWHYLFAPSEPRDNDLAIVLMKPPETPEIGRIQITDLLSLAQQYQAKGVALDFYFSDFAEDAGIDDALCVEVDTAKSASLPVYAVYDFKWIEDSPERVPIDPDLEKCLPVSQQGHAVGFGERDGRVRSLPLYFRSDPQMQSISLKVAKTFDSQIAGPRNGLLQFVRPASDFPTISFDLLDQGSATEREKLRDRFILVGEDSDQDSFPTPFGVKRGVVLHSYAIYSLRHNRFIKRGPWFVSLPMIEVCCYLLMALAAGGAGNWKLIFANVGFSLLEALIAIAAMYFWLTWIDLVYPLLAGWLFLLLLIILVRIRKKRRKDSTSVADQAPVSAT
jgi:CHASE2 domain-containing sensor protein